MEDQRWLTVKQVADQLQAHPETVREWLRLGKLRGHRISKRAGWRVRPEDVTAFVEVRPDADDGHIRDTK